MLVPVVKRSSVIRLGTPANRRAFQTIVGWGGGEGTAGKTDGSDQSYAELVACIAEGK